MREANSDPGEVGAMTPGEALFCRYAKGPNERGYCGPTNWDGKSVREFASQFTGAWAYQQVLAQMWNCDPLDEEVVRAYWLGTARSDAIDQQEFFARLLEVIGDRAKSYWGHLYDGSLETEAAPTHAFHVLGVYPWSRLLQTGMSEPLEVLNNCLLRPGIVENGGTVTAATLSFDPETGLALKHAPNRVENSLPPGTSVLLHWGEVCDQINAQQGDELQKRLLRQVERTNRRLLHSPADL